MRVRDAPGGTMGRVAEEHPKQRLIQGSPYVDDDGTADRTLLAALQAYADGTAGYPEVLGALAGARLLVPVVALLGEVELDEAGLAHDKSSDMATVLLTAPDGRRALLAFSGTEAMRAWDADARPVPVAAPLAASTALQEGADTLLVDVGSPEQLSVSGADLQRIAAGWRPVRVAEGWAWLGSAGEGTGDGA